MGCGPSGGPAKGDQESPSNTMTAQLRELADLRDSGIITEAEFQEMKQELLKRL